MIKNLLVVVMLLTLGACGNHAQPKDEAQLSLRYIKYYIRYLETGRELQMDAKYHNDSAAIAMLDGVYVDDIRLTAKELPREGWMHRYVGKSGIPNATFIFRYKLSPTVERQDTVEMPIYTDFELATPKIGKKTGGLLTWKGQPLMSNDGLVLIFEDSEGNNFTHTHRGITRGTQFEIRPDFIQTLAVGKGVLNIVHKRESRSTTATQQTFRQSEYYRKPIEFEIVE